MVKLVYKQTRGRKLNLLAVRRYHKEIMHIIVIILGSCLISFVMLLSFTLQTAAVTYPPTLTHSISVVNLSGDIITSMLPNQQVIITTTFMSHEDRPIPFVGFIEVRDNNDITQFLAWQSGIVPDSEIDERIIGVSWSTDRSSTYEVRSFAITDFESPQILSFIEIATIVVEIPPECKTRDCKYFFSADNAQYQEVYDKIVTPESTFTGLFTYDFDEKCLSPHLQRCTPYKLDGVSVYTGTKNFDVFVGHNVEIIGKKHSFDLEGYHLEEIWPVKLRILE